MQEREEEGRDGTSTCCMDMCEMTRLVQWLRERGEGAREERESQGKASRQMQADGMGSRGAEQLESSRVESSRVESTA